MKENIYSIEYYLIPIFEIKFTTQNLPIFTNYKQPPPLGKTRTSDLEISWKPTFYKLAMKVTKDLKLITQSSSISELTLTDHIEKFLNHIFHIN